MADAVVVIFVVTFSLPQNNTSTWYSSLSDLLRILQSGLGRLDRDVLVLPMVFLFSAEDGGLRGDALAHGVHVDADSFCLQS